MVISSIMLQHTDSAISNPVLIAIDNSNASHFGTVLVGFVKIVSI